MGAVRRVAAAAVTVVLLSGCAARYKANVRPGCTNAETLVLMAQSVPSAEQVPCIIANLPAGWEFQSVDIRNGRSYFSLDSDRAGDRAVEVTLRASCDVSGATDVASDEPGMTRHERVESLVGEYRGVRFYQFPGGCVTYRFNFERRGLALVNEVSLALGFISRADVARQAKLRL